MTKEILKQRVAVLERENKDLRLSKKVVEYTNTDLVGAIESLCTKKKQVQILNYAIKNAINRAITLTITNDKENEQVPEKPAKKKDFQKIAENKNTIIYVIYQDADSKALRYADIYAPEENAKQIHSDIKAITLKVEEFIQSLK